MPEVLACLVTGYPLPSIAWRKDGEEFTISSRVDIIQFPAETSIKARGYNESVVDLLMMHTSFTVDQVLQLGELGVVGLLSFEETVRGDTANYTCTATNAFAETRVLMITSGNMLVILGKFSSFMNAVTCKATTYTLHFSPQSVLIHLLVLLPLTMELVGLLFTGHPLLMATDQ